MFNNAWMRFFWLNNIKTRHLKNRLLEKCIVSYQFINLKLFHPEWINFKQNNMRFLNTGEFFFQYQDFKIWDHAFFSISPMPALNYFWSNTIYKVKNLTILPATINNIILVWNQRRGRSRSGFNGGSHQFCLHRKGLDQYE